MNAMVELVLEDIQRVLFEIAQARLERSFHRFGFREKLFKLQAKAFEVPEELNIWN